MDDMMKKSSVNLGANRCFRDSLASEKGLEPKCEAWL